MEYKYLFEIKIEEKIAVYGYNNIDLKMSDYPDNINTLTITNLSWIIEFNYNLLSTIL